MIMIFTLFNIRGARVEKMDNDTFSNVLQNQTDLTPSAQKVILVQWTREQQQQSERKDLNTALQLGQVLGFDWKLGVAVSSSHCGALKSPYVVVSIRTIDPSGKVRSYPLELTLSEFQVGSVGG